MELYIYEDYKDIFPELTGRELTDELIRETLVMYGAGPCSISRTEKGKPYVETAGAGGEVHLSVSHSGPYFLCLIADRPVGVDVQQARNTGTDRISRRYFTGEEREYIERHGEDGFFRLWTRKEAYSKYTGLGLQEILKGTQIINRDDVEFFDFQLEKGIYCSCCMKI